MKTQNHPSIFKFSAFNIYTHFHLSPNSAHHILSLSLNKSYQQSAMEVVNVSDAQNQDNKENIIPTSPLLSPTPPPPLETSSKKKTFRWRRMRVPLRDITSLYNSIEAQSSSSSLPTHQSLDFVASDSNSRKRKAAEDNCADSLKQRQIAKSLRMGFR